MSRDLDNAAVAERLDAFAGLLDLSGASPYAARAYRRAAETIREARVPIAELVRQGREQELRGIGPGIAARLRELVETGTLAELDALRRDLRPELVGLGRLLGVSPKRMLELANALGVNTPDEFREAVADGRLQSVRGVGPATEAKLRARLEPGPGSQGRAVPLSRARALLGGIADGLGGQMAGDPRRFSDVGTHRAVVAAATRPAETLAAFERLPESVAIVERGQTRAVGVTVEGVPVELRLAPPGRFGTEVIMATGSPAYVDALGPLPAAPDE